MAKLSRLLTLIALLLLLSSVLPFNFCSLRPCRCSVSSIISLPFQSSSALKPDARLSSNLLLLGLARSNDNYVYNVINSDNNDDLTELKQEVSFETND